MTRILVGIIAVLMAAQGLWFLRSESLKQQISERTNQINVLTIQQQNLAERLSQSLATVNSLREIDKNNIQQKKQLQANLTALEKQNANNHQFIRELQNENQELRDWAKQPLPTAINRLRQRPAITGTHRYCDHLRSTRTMQTQSIFCTDQR